MGLDFSIVKGGPLYWLGRRLDLADGPRSLFQMAAILAAITWLPLFGLYQTVVLFAASVVPMLPLLLTAFPLDELVLRSVKSLVGM